VDSRRSTASRSFQEVTHTSQKRMLDRLLAGLNFHETPS
jgi:hypothetical protein